MTPTKPLITTFVFTILIITTTQAQKTQKIIDKANENKERRSDRESRPRSSNSSSYSFDGGGDGDGDADGFFFFLELLGKSVEGIAILQSRILDKEYGDDIARISSLELSTQFGALPTEYSISKSTLQANWGLFSASARYYHQHENRVGNHALYNTFDLQIIQINALPFKHFNLRFGLGIMNEHVTSSTYTERTVCLDIFPIDRLQFSAEGRFSRDPDTTIQVRREWNFGAYYRLGKQDKMFDFYAHTNMMHARYYESINIWSISGGLTIKWQ